MDFLKMELYPENTLKQKLLLFNCVLRKVRSPMPQHKLPPMPGNRAGNHKLPRIPARKTQRDLHDDPDGYSSLPNEEDDVSRRAFASDSSVLSQTKPLLMLLIGVLLLAVTTASGAAISLFGSASYISSSSETAYAPTPGPQLMDISSAVSVEDVKTVLLKDGSTFVSIHLTKNTPWQILDGGDLNISYGDNENSLDDYLWFHHIPSWQNDFWLSTVIMPVYGEQAVNNVQVLLDGTVDVQNVKDSDYLYQEQDRLDSLTDEEAAALEQQVLAEISPTVTLIDPAVDMDGDLVFNVCNPEGSWFGDQDYGYGQMQILYCKDGEVVAGEIVDYDAQLTNGKGVFYYSPSLPYSSGLWDDVQVQVLY